MEKLDLKDRKILYELDLDSRQSFRSLGRKVGLSKDVVTSRVKKLQDMQIIQGYYAIIDYAKLGFSLYRFYFSFQNVTTDLKKEIINYFMNEKYVATVKSLEGNYDLIVAILVKNYPQAQSFWQKTLKNYGKYFSKRIFNAFYQEDSYAYRVLLDRKNNRPTRIYQYFDSGKRVDIDDLDYQIIKLITQNSRISTVDIANSLNSTSSVVQNRLKKLNKSDIIIAYRLNIDFTKIGYYIYKVDIVLDRFDEINNIITYIELNPYLVYKMGTIGYVDLEISFLLNNSIQLNHIMEDISSKFPGAIKNYSYYIGVKTYKDYEPL